MLAYELYLRAREIGQRSGLSTAERTKHQVALLDQTVARDPMFVPALCLLARVHVQSYWSNHDHTPARLDAAWKALEAAARLKPDAGEVYLTRGILHYWGKRDYEPALAELALARRALPNDADVPYFIALIKRRQGDWEGSTRHLEQARTLDPRNAVILFDLARTNYFALKRYREAAETSDHVLSWKPNDFSFALARAKVDIASKADLRRIEALLASDAVKTAEPELLAWERIELALLQRNFAAAEEAAAASVLPEFNWAGYVTPREWFDGIIAQAQGQTEKARAAFAIARDALAAVVEKRPDDAKAHIVLAEICSRMGAKEEAVREAEHAMELRPVSVDAVDGPHILERAAGVYAQIGEGSRALELLERAAKMPNGPNYGALMLENTWDPLRNDPAFNQIVASLGPR